MQLPSISMCEGGTGTTLPSITPPKSATQPRDDCASEGVAVSSDITKANSRIPIQLYPLLTLFLIPLRQRSSRRRQEVDRVHDRHGLHFLRAEIHLPDAAYNLSGEVRRIHVGRLQLAHRHTAVRFDREAQHHLAFQGRVVAQFPVVQPVERRLVAIKDDLYFFVGAGRPRSAARLRPVFAADGGTRPDRTTCAHPASSAPPAAGAATADSATTAAAATGPSATASHAAVQRGGVDATTRSRRIGGQGRA